MNVKNGAIIKAVKISGLVLYNHAKNKSASISSSASTITEDQTRIPSESNNVKVHISDNKPKAYAANIKEDTINFIRKGTTEVDLSTTKLTQVNATKISHVRNQHFNSGIQERIVKTMKTGPNPIPIKVIANKMIINKICEITPKASPPNNSLLTKESIEDNRETDLNNDLENSKHNGHETVNVSIIRKKRLQRYASVDFLKNTSKSMHIYYNDLINIEDLIILEDKYLDILTSINKKKNLLTECFEWWSYYFDSSLCGEKYDEFFIENSSKIVIHTANNLELFAVLFCYYVSEELAACRKFNELLNIIFTSLHTNYLFICMFMLMQIGINKNPTENIWFGKMNTYVKRALCSQRNDDITEKEIVQIIKENSQSIVESLKKILNHYSKRSLYGSLTYYFNHLTKVTNEHLKDFFRQEVYNAFKQESNADKILEMNHHKKKTTIQVIRPPYLDNKRTKPYTLVLDLDETLISTKVKNDTRGIVIFRPGLMEFLSALKDYYELVSFTAASQDYAESILEMIEEKQKFFNYRLFQSHTVLCGKDYVKDISLLGRELSTVIIVDNMPHNFKLQKENGILIKSFYGDKKNDSALSDLLPILIKIAKEKGDVRKSIQKYKTDLMKKVASKLDYLNEKIN